MLSTTFLITALAASLQVSAGPAVPRSEQGNLTMRVDFDLWAQFCNDKACSEGCVHHVPRRYKRVGRLCAGCVALPGCPCCVLSDTQCLDISEFGGKVQSFRFNGASQGSGTCDANNC
ncbi:hypothetical protein B0H19DRAFT_1276945 [Mycena capillaripes]|nr:hypothetical protein B0H19DRAFT_1276945 [Mycena capillaripes]